MAKSNRNVNVRNVANARTVTPTPLRMDGEGSYAVPAVGIVNADVRDKIVSYWSAFETADAELEAARAEQMHSQKQAVAAMVSGILLSHQVAPFDLSPAVSGDKTAIAALNTILRRRLGLLSATGTPVPGAERLFGPTKAEIDEATNKGDTAALAVMKKRGERARNFATTLKEAAQKALGVIDVTAGGGKWSIEEGSSLLKIEGPKVEAAFGSAAVVIDKAGTRESVPEGKRPPRATALRDIAIAKHGKKESHATKANAASKATRAEGVTAASVAETFESFCNRVIEAINRIGDSSMNDEEMARIRRLAHSVRQALAPYDTIDGAE